MSASATITVLDSPQRPVRGLVPDSACDCHVHVFGPAALRAMHEAGIRGTRINLSVTGKADAQQARDRITAVATRKRDLNWHLQLNIGSEIVVELADIQPYLTVDDGASLSRFIQVAGDEQLVRRILADNPAELYEF